jgi:hypothetical protein
MVVEASTGLMVGAVCLAAILVVTNRRERGSKRHDPLPIDPTTKQVIAASLTAESLLGSMSFTLALMIGVFAFAVGPVALYLVCVALGAILWSMTASPALEARKDEDEPSTALRVMRVLDASCLLAVASLIGLPLWAGLRHIESLLAAMCVGIVVIPVAWVLGRWAEHGPDPADGAPA